ncbi:MAG: hypothetical protein PVH38_12835, partial [Gammaproteobacteria bacterium]
SHQVTVLAVTPPLHKAHGAMTSKPGDQNPLVWGIEGILMRYCRDLPGRDREALGTRRVKYQPSIVTITRAADNTNASASFENSVTSLAFL